MKRHAPWDLRFGMSARERHIVYWEGAISAWVRTTLGAGMLARTRGLCTRHVTSSAAMIVTSIMAL